MNTWLGVSLVCCVMAFTAQGSSAQDTSPAGRDPCAPLDPDADPPGQLIYVVTGRPYSAVVETEVTRTLKDGTRIEQKNSEVHQYRDSAGRIRMEYAPLG
jgi:hypothetical protein